MADMIAGPSPSSKAWRGKSFPGRIVIFVPSLVQAMDEHRARDAIKIRAADHFFIYRLLLGYQSL
jgi:hypothetical protein